MRRPQARRGSFTLLLIALLVTCLAPVGAAALTGVATEPDEIQTAASVVNDDGRGAAGSRDAGTGGNIVGSVPMGGSAPSTATGPGATAGPPPSPDVTAAAPPSTIGPAPPSTAPSPVPPPTSPTAPEPPTTIAPPPPSPQEQVVVLANTARAEAGCGPVHIDDRLTGAAQAHSEDMAAHDYFSHTSLDGTTWDQRVKAAGYPEPGGENIAQGQRSAEAVHDAWMSSPGHRRNILDCSFTAVGVGLEPDTWTWTQDFGL